MKKFAIFIFAFALLGMISLFIPMQTGSMFSIFLEFDRFRLVLMLAAFAVPMIACGAALKAPRPQQWHGIAALGGFAIATVKSEVWNLVRQLGGSPLPFKLLAVAILGGTVCSLIAVATEERPA